MELPRLARIRQRFPAEAIEGISAAVDGAVTESGVATRLQPGARVAITAGSRGIARIVEILASLVTSLRHLGAEPFIVPAMGSHGGATAQGQRSVLAGYGITEASVGAPIRATMEVVQLGSTPHGVPVWLDRNAAEADGIVIAGRVKPHTAFRAPIESGMCKMIAIGLGKQRGAETIHAQELARTIPEVASVAIREAPVIMGLAILENGYDQPYRIVGAAPDQIHATDRKLLVSAKDILPRIPFDDLDVLIVDWLGKNISGSGMDPNVIGLWRRLGGKRQPDYRRIFVRNITPESHGNALGVGWADFTTRRLVDQIDYQAMYMNCLTANAPDVGRIPITLANDREALEASLKTAGATQAPRVARIHSTLQLEHIFVSEALLSEAKENPRVEVLSDLASMDFDTESNLLSVH